jgi:uncharacterized membrane protein YsdA (DUF1294 family)
MAEIAASRSRWRVGETEVFVSAVFSGFAGMIQFVSCEFKLSPWQFAPGRVV